ncbi:hypothetical protein CEW91_07890 [Idiomarina piscisalsi]|uniref:Uncharacterized protein n=1 Tax=Idiomarina piscisalsi TaxID=1096243 RepID=A0ABN5AQT7_9GAMM|nr:hypothetical protein [Idiomarina piscisalsi]ASG66074.1 hypothetical protein CEW91_07890 [Idiomarina piscisalsi]
MSSIDRSLLNRLLVLSAAIAEMIELESHMLSEFRESTHQLAGRNEYLAFWLRAQSFFVSAQSLTDSKQIKQYYLTNTAKHWRFGIKALRHFFAHEIDFIPSLHTSVRFIPEEKVSISLEGFVIRTAEADLILRNCVKNDWRRELRKKEKNGALPFGKVKMIYKKHRTTQLRTLNDWRSRPNENVVVITDIATRHYLIAYELLNALKRREQTLASEVAEETAEYDSGVIPLKDKVKSIEDTVAKVKAYRDNKFKWSIN